MTDKPTIEERDDLQFLLKEGSDEELQSFLEVLHPADIADLVEQVDERSRKRIFSLLPERVGADVIPEIEDHVWEDVLKAVPEERLVEFVDEMDTDDAADLIAELPREQARSILARIDASDSEEIRKLLNYGPETAGGLMQTELIAILEDATVAEAIEEIRKQRDEVEHVHFVFVVDENRRLKGVLDLKDLLLADSDQKVSEIMNPDVISCRVDTDQEEVAALMMKYDLVSLPVVDPQGRLVGRVVIDDVMDALEDEVDEDFLLMAGAGEQELEETSLLGSVRSRLPWLFITWVGEIATGAVIGYFSDTLQQVILLTTFIPIVMAMGGNVGTQSATIMVRGMATGRIDYRRMGKFLVLQLLVGLALGLVMGFALSVFVQFKYNAFHMALVTGVAIFAVMTFAALVGTLFPALFTALGVDPAVATAPFISTFCDIMGIFIYLSLATGLLKYLG